MKIAVVAPSNTLKREAAEQVAAIASARGDCELVIHPQCFLSDGHFAGSDADRLAALREAMADPSIDAIWFARGGYGSNRIAEAALADLPAAARTKQYLGYSDAGFLLAGMHKSGLDVAWGPMPQDVRRDRGDTAVRRALGWLVRHDPSALEPNSQRERALAFNITVFGQLLGTPLEPDVRGHVLMLEDVSEHMYRTDRALFHITSNAAVRAAAGIRLGRCTDVPDNDPDFGATEEEVVRFWCERSGIPFLGRADIGHDADNKVVPFGSP